MMCKKDRRKTNGERRANTTYLQVDIPQMEDLILNPLNSILLLCHGSNIYTDVEKQIRRIVEVLERKSLINKRMVPTQISYPDRYYTA